jgi:cell shape-determining protein MreC
LKGKNLLVLAVVALVLFWMIKDPVSAAGGARQGLGMLISGLQAIANALTTFLKGLLR